MFGVKIPFLISGYEKQCEGMYTYAPEEIECDKWFLSFRSKIIDSMGKDYLPVCRISDGEFLALLGYQWMNLKYPLKKMLRNNFNYILQIFFHYQRISAHTLPIVSSGKYDISEVRYIRNVYGNMLTKISELGILAIHLSNGRKPFQQHYYRKFAKFLKEFNIELTFQNYVPFYFIYPMLTGSGNHELFDGKRILLINGAEKNKKEKIISSVFDLGAKEIHWLGISNSKSMYDQINVDEFVGKIDIAFLGAGIGKPNILLQLAKLKIPCIDAGYVFEIWADNSLGSKRRFCSYNYHQ